MKPLTNNYHVQTTKLQTYAIAYEIGIRVKDITSTQIIIESDCIVVHYFARYYNSPINLRKVLSYSDICDIVNTHGLSLLVQ